MGRPIGLRKCKKCGKWYNINDGEHICEATEPEIKSTPVESKEHEEPKTADVVFETIQPEPKITEVKKPETQPEQKEQIEQPLSDKDFENFYEFIYDMVSTAGRRVGIEYPEWDKIDKQKRIRIGKALYRIEQRHPDMFSEWMLDAIDLSIVVSPLILPIVSSLPKLKEKRQLKKLQEDRKNESESNNKNSD